MARPKKQGIQKLASGYGGGIWESFSEHEAHVHSDYIRFKLYVITLLSI